MGGTTAWVLGDQLSPDNPALVGADRALMIESAARATRRRRYHRRKLVLVFSAMRHRAAELEGELDVDYRESESTFEAIADHVDRYSPDRLTMVGASEYQGRRFQESLGERLGVDVEILPNTQMLVERHDPFPDADLGKRVVMESFYREMRRHFDVLMDGPDPVGGRWNLDDQNRKPYPRSGLDPPKVPSFEPDAITREVMRRVAGLDGIGSVEGFDLAVTRAGASSAFGNFIAQRLEAFGPYEDAMAANHDHLYHSVLSPYLNIGLLDPLDLVRSAERAHFEGRAPLNSVEGFVRQIIGWREFVYWSYWRMMPGLITANSWGHRRGIPDWWWTGETDMRCLSSVIGRVTESGYSHHIERLMILCNFAMLARLDPSAVNEWFLSMYVDAYEWVVTPNVIGMGLNADGGVIATKPYIASANYINKMSDFCGECTYSHTQRTGERACPFNHLYWNFLIRNEERLRSNPRSGRAVLGLAHLDAEERRQVQEQAEAFLGRL